VPERVLRLTGNRRTPLVSDELLAPERMQPLLDQIARLASDHCDRAEPEDLADDGRVLQQGLLLRRKRVQARRDDSLHRLRDRELACAGLLDHVRELLRVERVAAGPCDEQRAGHLRQRARLD
jgi:hypothetical protein